MTARPVQAVIAAGGRGERLRPLTDERPKPMIEFHGRPFLDYLLDMLVDNGVRRVLLLLGYRADVIVDRYGDGYRGIDIEYAVSPPAIQTGRRVWLARDRIDPTFLFLYCDNYWPMTWPRMWDSYVAGGRPAQLTVYRNDDGYSRDNVTVDQAGRVIRYDRTRMAPELRGVEIGYAIMDRRVLELLDGSDVAFEDAVYPTLVERDQLGAFVTPHRYYSVGTLARLPATADFLERRPAVILDRDGVLNERPPRAQYVRSPDELRWLPQARDALRLFAESGYRVIVATNQAGIGRGRMSEQDLAAVNAALIEGAAAAGGRIDAIYHCPHDWDDGCECRKPRPGMLIRAQRELGLDLTRTVFIGDDERDAATAAAAGSPSILVDEDRNLLDVTRELLATANRD